MQLASSLRRTLVQHTFIGQLKKTNYKTIFMTIAEFNHLPVERKSQLLSQCCGSKCWIEKIQTVFPVEDLVELLEAAEEKWYECNESDWREAFEHHPKIGDIDSLKEKFAGTAQWAADEQSGAITTSSEVLQDLTDGNKMYQEKFGFIFIVCATGKSAQEMLNLLQERLLNEPTEEIKIAMAEQNKITKLRIEKLFA
jgi:2-oxo-4-hydroxy-4-carboxy-5-ureidoimidazoline decarboxylase